MPACKKHAKPYRRRAFLQRCAGIGGVFLGALFSARAEAQNGGHFEIVQASTGVQDTVYTLDAQLSFRLSQEAEEALHNGVSLVLVLEVNVRQERSYLWDDSLATLEQRYHLSHHNLSDRYIIDNENIGVRNSFPSLYAALNSLGRVQRLPLLDRSLIEPGKRYYVELSSYLDIEALPAPLRPAAYLSPAWRLTSETYVCPLNR